MLADAIVVGAGIVGAACARELMLAGIGVTVCERGVIGGGATAAGMGHLAVMDDSEAQFALTSYSQKLWRELSHELPAAAEYLPSGSLWIAADGEEMDEVRRKFAFYQPRGIPVEILDSRQLAEAEPNLRSGLCGGLLMGADSVCYPPVAAEFFVRGCDIVRQRVVSFSENGVRLESGQEIRARWIVFATGTWATQLFPDLAVQPRKGHLVITDRHHGYIRHQLIELGYLKSAHSHSADSVAFNAQPRSTGQVLIGSSRQFGVTDSAVESPILTRMLLRAIEYLPDLAHLSAIRSWTGFRAATPDKLPFIGRAPGYDSVFVATGHEGLGISTSLATARLLVDEILGKPSAIPRQPYAPDRKFS